MTAAPIEEIKPTNEIIKSECQERRVKEINVDVFCNGILYTANKVLVYFRVLKEEYYIVISTNRGYLVSTAIDSIHSAEEFEFICAEAEVAKEKLPVTINFFGYKLYDKNMEQLIIAKDSPSDTDSSITAQNDPVFI